MPILAHEPIQPSLADKATFDNYEISPCRRFDEPDRPGHFYFEPCDPHEADVWTLYGHLPEGGVEAVGDFSTREFAEDIAFRIIGEQFTGDHAARLRAMRAGPVLLAALQSMVRWTELHGLSTAELITGGRAEVPVVSNARAAIELATATKEGTAP